MNSHYWGKTLPIVCTTSTKMTVKMKNVASKLLTKNVDSWSRGHTSRVRQRTQNMLARDQVILKARLTGEYIRMQSMLIRETCKHSCHVDTWAQQHEKHVGTWARKHVRHIRTWTREDSIHVGIWTLKHAKHISTWAHKHVRHVGTWERKHIRHVGTWARF